MRLIRHKKDGSPSLGNIIFKRSFVNVSEEVNISSTNENLPSMCKQLQLL
jgi:hypothetical protein